jgi:hypothetical protein
MTQRPGVSAQRTHSQRVPHRPRRLRGEARLFHALLARKTFISVVPWRMRYTVFPPALPPESATAAAACAVTAATAPVMTPRRVLLPQALPQARALRRRSSSGRGARDAHAAAGMCDRGVAALRAATCTRGHGTSNRTQPHGSQRSGTARWVWLG